MLEDREVETLVKGVRESAAFRVAPQRAALFNYLWDHRDEATLSGDIWDEVLLAFNRSKRKDKPEFDLSQNVRERCRDLRAALIDHFADVRDGWRIDLPPAVQGEGYRLALLPRTDPHKATFSFWQPHFQSGDVVLIYAHPIFYYDINDGFYLRFLDTNAEVTNREAALVELDRLHNEQLKKWYGGFPKDSLRPTHVYVGIGEVAALDLLSEWFAQRPFIRVKKAVSDQISSVKSFAPILLGSFRSNRFINAFLGSEEGQHFGYRIHESLVGHIAISKPSAEETALLQRFQARADNDGGRLIAGSPASTSPVRDRFVVVTRMRNPGSKTRYVTIISSDTSLAIQSVAQLLTDDDQITEMMHAMGWPASALPSSFEILLSVRIAPGNMDDEADHPELLCWRTYA